MPANDTWTPPEVSAIGQAPDTGTQASWQPPEVADAKPAWTPPEVASLSKPAADEQPQLRAATPEDMQQPNWLERSWHKVTGGIQELGTAVSERATEANKAMAATPTLDAIGGWGLVHGAAAILRPSPGEQARDQRAKELQLGPEFTQNLSPQEQTQKQKDDGTPLTTGQMRRAVGEVSGEEQLFGSDKSPFALPLWSPGQEIGKQNAMTPLAKPITKEDDNVEIPLGVGSVKLSSVKAVYQPFAKIWNMVTAPGSLMTMGIGGEVAAARAIPELADLVKAGKTTEEAQKIIAARTAYVAPAVAATAAPELATTAIFSKGMTEGAIQQLDALPGIVRDPNKTDAQKGAALADSAVSMGMSYLALNHLSGEVQKIALDPSLTNEAKIDALAMAQDLPHDAVMKELGDAAEAKAEQIKRDFKPLPANAQVSIPKEGEIGTPTITIPGKEGGESRSPLLNEPAPEFHGSPEEAKAAGYDITQQEHPSGEGTVATDFSLDGMQKLVETPTPVEDAARYEELNRETQAIMDKARAAGEPLTDSPEYAALAKEREEIEGRNGGMPPGKVAAEPSSSPWEPPEVRATKAESPDVTAEQAARNRANGIVIITDKDGNVIKDSSSGETYGIAARVSAARAKAGKIDPIQPGEGTTPQEIIQKGRDLIDQGADPQAVADRVRNTGASSENDVAIARAHGEDLAQAAKAAADKFGIDSPEYAAAKKADFDWQQNVIQPMRTAWHKKGMAMQGETDIDTESYHGLAKAVHAVTGEDLDPKQTKEAKDLSDQAAKLKEEVESLKQKVLDGVQKAAAEKAKPPKKGLGLGDYFKDSAAAARARVSDRLGKLVSKNAVEGDNLGGLLSTENLSDLATIAADHLARGLDAGAELGKEFGEWVKPHVDAILKKANEAIQSAYETKSAAALEARRTQLTERVAELEKKIKTGDISTEPKKANRPATETIEPLIQQRDALNKQLADLRKEAAKPTEAELVQRKVDAINKQIEEKKAALASGDVEAKPKELNRPQPEAIEKAKQELEDVNRQIAEARKAIPANEEKNVTQDVWTRAKDLLEKGEDDYPSIVNKIATDTGLPEEQVHKILAGPKEVRTLTDEMYRKMADRRNLVRQAQDWVKDQQTPGYIKAVKMLPNAMFRMATALHGTVFGVTHAAINIFDPLEWGTYWPNFLRQFKLMGVHDGGAYHERMMQQLEADPLFDFAARAGLNNSPHHITDDFQSAWTTHYLRQIGLMGNRGMDAIKIMRQAMFNNAWEKFPPDMRDIKTRNPVNAQLLADAINHATGSIRKKLDGWTQYTFFSARLEGSRWAWMIQDPAKATEIFSRMLLDKPTTYAERQFAWRELKHKAVIVSTYMGLLAANQGLLSASDSKQKVNRTDPMKPDFLTFKAGGKELSPVSPMLGLVRLAANLFHITMGTRDKFEKRDTKFDEATQKIGEYARGRLSPSAGVATDATMGADAVGRQMPWTNMEVPTSGKVSLNMLRQEGRKYTYTEYASTHFLPLFAEEAVREVWKNQGVNETTMQHWIDGLSTAALMGTTGFKLKEDPSVKK